MSSVSPKGLTVMGGKAFCMACQRYRNAEGFKRIPPGKGTKFVKAQWRCAECAARHGKGGSK